MANIKSVAKRARQSVKLHAKNLSIRSEVKSAQKSTRKAITAGNPADAKKAYEVLSSKLDKAAKRGVIHPNAANRGKSRLKKALNKLEPATAAA